MNARALFEIGHNKFLDLEKIVSYQPPQTQSFDEMIAEISADDFEGFNGIRAEEIYAKDHFKDFVLETLKLGRL